MVQSSDQNEASSQTIHTMHAMHDNAPPGAFSFAAVDVISINM
jgi:hypothetical protein